MKINYILENNSNIKKLLEQSKEYYENVPLFRIGTKDLHSSINYDVFYQDVLSACSYMMNKGIKGENIALIGELGYYWYVVFFAVTLSGNSLVPIDREISNETLSEYFKRADISGIFIDACHKNKMQYLNENYDYKLMVSFGKSLDKFTNIESVLVGKTDLILADIEDYRTAVLAFTSGTTANCKIVELSHLNLCADVGICVDTLNGEFEFGEVVLAVLPAHHMFSLTTNVLMPLALGLTIGIGGGIKYLNRDIKLLKPSLMMCVPAIAEGLNKRIYSELNKEGELGQFNKSVSTTNQMKNLSMDYKRKVFKSVNQALGGNLRILICGGAPLNSENCDIFDKIGIELLNGYGITECSPVISCNKTKNNRIQSVGKPGVPNICTVAINNGEVCVKGAIVMKGYYKNHDAYVQCVNSGWFRTGDLGKIDEKGYLIIEGRVNNLIILPDGNNISPEELEIPLQKISLVKSVFVDSCVRNNTNMLVAHIYLDWDEIPESERECIKIKIETEIKEVNKTFPLHKRIVSIDIVEQDFEKSSLGKIKRYKYNEEVN